MTQEELQKMLDEIPNKKFAKFTDKQLEGYEKIKIIMSSENSPLRGKKCDENKKEKISNTLKGKSKGCKGYKLTDEHKKIISKVQSNKKLSDETKEKLRIINLNKTSGKSVSCFLYPSMEFFKKYDNLSTATKELNLHRECARLTCVGKRNHTNGYTFRYDDII
jgi:hypothetical protein